MGYVERRLVLSGDIGSGEVKTEDVGDLQVTNAKVADATLAKGKLAADTIRLETPITLAHFPTGLATDSTGVKMESNNILISSDLLSCAKAVYFESGLLQLTGGTVRIELYGVTEAAVIAYLEFTATGGRSRTADIKASLVAGREYYARFNVTVAGGSGSVGGNAQPKLVVVLGVS